MSEFMFGVSRTKPTRAIAKKLRAIAKRHGAYLVEMVDPGSGYKRWFAARNMGHPFDSNRATAVAADINREIGTEKKTPHRLEDEINDYLESDS